MEVKEKNEKHNARESVLKINNMGKLIEADYSNLSSTQNNLRKKLPQVTDNGSNPR